jgi:hypothetical protein
MTSFSDDATMASGFLLAAEVLLRMLSAALDQPAADVARMATLLVAQRYPDPSSS